MSTELNKEILEYLIDTAVNCQSIFGTQADNILKCIDLGIDKQLNEEYKSKLIVIVKRILEGKKRGIF